MKAATIAINLTGRPRWFHNGVVIGVRVRSLTEVTMTLAVDPMMVSLPLRPALRIRAYHSGVTRRDRV